MKIRFLFILTAIFLGFTTAFPQEKGLFVSGHVYDIETSAPLANVNVYISGTQLGTSSDDNGYFKLRIRKFPVLLYFSFMGYEVKPIALKAPETEPLKIYLRPEVRQIGEVTITGERVANLFKGDTLNVVDYEIYKDQIIMVANPYKNMADQRLYLTSLTGDIQSYRKVRHAGREIEDPELLAIKKNFYLFRDCFGEIQLFTQNKIWQILPDEEDLYLLYPTEFDDFMKLIFPVKAAIEGSLIYQKSTRKINQSWLISDGEAAPKLVTTVTDPYGDFRYARPIDFIDGLTVASEFIIKKSYERCVTAPVITVNGEFAIFDFFGNRIGFFDAAGEALREVPISFHLKEYYELLIIKSKDIDIGNFTQQVVYDEIAKRVWTVWRPKPGNQYVLKEINLQTGQVASEAPIPDFPNVSKIRVYNNTIYFLYTEKTYPYYQSLYRMVL